jgi:hypothetical protein
VKNAAQAVVTKAMGEMTDVYNKCFEMGIKFGDIALKTEDEKAGMLSYRFFSNCIKTRQTQINYKRLTGVPIIIDGMG